MISDEELKELCNKSYAIDPMKQDSRRPQTNKSIYGIGRFIVRMIG